MRAHSGAATTGEAVDDEFGTPDLSRAQTYMEDPLRMVTHLIMSTPEYQIDQTVWKRCMTMTDRSKKLCDMCGVSRRQALKIGARGIGLGLLGGLGPLPPLLGATSKALAATEGKILVVFEWFGGYDGLSTFVPYGDDALYRHRPTIGNIAATQTLAVRARDHVPVVFNDPNAFSRNMFHPQRPYIEKLDTGQVARGDVHKFLLDVNQSAREASALVSQAWENYSRTRNTDLRLLDLDKVVALIENDFPARLYYVRLRNSLFDTHVNQESPHNRQVQYCSDAVWRFFEEMKRLGKQDEVAILVHSEFGRRVPENTSLGTDHGTANVAFVLGGGVTGGQYSSPPSLTELVLGDNLQHTTDFRRLYATLIEEFLGYSKSENVLGRQFQTLGMFT